MGVVHKLNPEVRDFIIEQKKIKPSLSCRAFTLLISEKLNVKVSKSSINAIFKEAGLSMPIGRRVKHKKQKVETLGDRVKLALQGPVEASAEIKPEPVVKEQPALVLPEPVQENKQAAEEKILQDIQKQKDALLQEAERQAEEIKKAQEQEQLRKAQEEETRRQEEEARIAAEQAAQEERRLKEEKAAQEEARQKAEQQEELRKAEEEAQRAEAQRKVAEESRIKEEEKRKAEEDIRLAAKAAEEARLKEEEQLRKIQEEARLKEEAAVREEAQRKAAEEASRLASEQAVEDSRRKEEELRLASQQAAQEARQKEEEQAAQEAGFKEEQEKWAKRAEEERRIASAASKTRKEPEQSPEEKILQEIQEQQDRLAQETVKRAEEAQRKVDSFVRQEEQRKEEELRLASQQAAQEERQKEEQATQGATARPAEISSGRDDELKAVSVLPQNRVSTGALLLKAIDCLLGGSSQINAILCRKINRDPAEMLPLTQALIFNSLFEKNQNFSELWSLVGKQYTKETLQSYSEQVQQVRSIKLDILHVISSVFTEARGVKVHFSEGDVVYLDGQLRTTWSTASLPSDFSGTVYGLKNYLNRHFFESAPLVLFTAPGYDIPPKEFFTLLFNFNNTNKAPDFLTLYGNKLEDLESISLPPQKTYSVVFCLWPWQFTTQRKVKKLGDFKPSHIESVNKDLYLGEIEMDLLQPSLGQSITLKGCAVKTSLNEKTRMVILSNNMPVTSLDKLMELYLSHWPNLEESFQDFSRKIELSTYTGNAQKFTSLSDSAAATEPAEELEEIFASYVKMLDTYLRWYFLPSGYQEKDFVFTNEHFYKLPAMFVANKEKVSVKMKVGADYAYLKDLEYLIRRFNERQIDFDAGQVFSLENLSRA